MRSLLFVPGNRPERFAKARDSGADNYCIDLEDAVPQAQKEAARNAALAHIADRKSGGSPCYLRINSLATKYGLEDLLALSTAAAHNALPDCVVLPMASSSFEVRQIIQVLSCHPDLKILPMIETPEGLDNLPAMLLEGRGRIAALALGCADYAAAIGSDMSWDALLDARSALLRAASAHAVPCLDGPFFDIPNLAGLREDAARVSKLGFLGKLAIHPSQVNSINEVFAPSQEKVDWAKKVIAAFEKAGGGVVSFEGMMIDQPMVDQAKRILAGEKA
ncbi:MAG: CoA ester lyase [Proteobacteria bacterium]|nr:CoA ester lyase [Pseudomonadota bacterium]